MSCLEGGNHSTSEDIMWHMLGKGAEDCARSTSITSILLLLMEEILHQLIRSLSHHLQSFIHPRWCRISSINSSNVNPGLINPLPPYTRRSRRFSIDFEVTNPPQIKRHLTPKHWTTLSLLLNKKTIEFQNGGALIGVICCIPLLTRGEIWTNTKNLACGKRGQSNWRGG